MARRRETEALANQRARVRRLVQSLRLWPSQFEGQTVLDWTVDTGSAIDGAGFRDGAGDSGEHGEALVNSGGGGRREGLDIKPPVRGERMGRVRDF